CIDLVIKDVEAPVISNPDADPASIVADGTETSQLSVTVVDDSDIDFVTVDLSAIGGDAAQEMTCIEGTDTYTVTVTAAEGTVLGAHCLYVNASDVFGNYDDTSICIELNITTSGEDIHTISLDAGWNMVSIPVIPADASVNAIFGDNIITPVYEYNAGYKAVTSLEPKKGYWVLANSAVDISINGTVPSDLEVMIVPGWNMIGPVSSNVQVSSFTDIIPPVYKYDAGYKSVTVLEKTKGYWVLASAETTLTV
ncbi:MAG: Ig-like domain-containing protein, partial [Euryarchaeota archaeon]|nr:Ig-like domain-containing protein [Euryarchaeota archaeon]